MSKARVRVLVVGLGTMGTSHARAYKAIEGFELVGLMHPRAAGAQRSRRGISRRSALRRARRGARGAEARRRRDLPPIPSTTRRMALKALAAGAHVFCEKPLADSLEAAERIRRGGARSQEGAGDRLHPARPSVVVALRRDRPDARQAAGHAHEPQPAIGWVVLGGAQEPDEVDLAAGRLRRPLRRRHVPGDGRAAGRGACGRRAPDRRDRADDVQLRPSRHHLRRRLGRLVRGRLGTDDQRDRPFREGHHRAERLGVDRLARERRRDPRNPPTTTPTPRPTRCVSTTPRSTRMARSPSPTTSSRPKTSPATRISAIASSSCSSRRSAARST